MKFYAEIIAGLRAFFNMPEATESELHQTLIEAKTYDELKADAIKEAGATMEKLNEVSDKVNAMTAEMDTMKADNEAKGTQIEGLEERVRELTTATNAKDETISKYTAEIENLSTQLSTFKVKAAPAGSPKEALPAGESLAVQDAPKQKVNRQEITNEQMRELFK